MNKIINQLILIPMFLISLVTYAQNYNPNKGGGLYGTGSAEVDKGWYFGVGGTYTIAYSTVTSVFDSTDASNNTHSNLFTADPYGKFGLSGEIGLFKMTDKKIINYIDFGLAYKWFRGGEDYLLEYYMNDNFVFSDGQVGSYSDHFLSGHLNLGYRYDRNDDLFFVNGLGLNLDYAIVTGRTQTPLIPGVEYNEGEDLLGELHYFFGVGFKTSKRLIIMPMIETPILAIYPFNHIESTHSYFNTRARPLVFKVRFMFLKKGSKSCPPVYNPAGLGMD